MSATLERPIALRNGPPPPSRHLLYIIGLPGSGKTTLARALVLGRRRRVQTTPFAFTTYEDGLVQLGRDRLGHGGTDALSMSVQPRVVAALATGAWPRVLGEGDRLANASFFADARGVGYKVDVALLDVSPELAAERRRDRGTDQAETWLRGRQTKLERLAMHVTIRLDGRWSVDALAGYLGEHPVIRGNV